MRCTNSFLFCFSRVLRKIIQHLEIRQKITACQGHMKHVTGTPQNYWFFRGSVLSFDLLLTLDLSSGSVKLDVLLDWSIANAFCKLKMKKICLVERVKTSELTVLCLVGWVTNYSHLPGTEKLPRTWTFGAKTKHIWGKRGWLATLPTRY